MNEIAALLVWSVPVALPFLIERFYFGAKFGLFAVLFWLFVCQSGILLIGEILIPSPIGSMSPEWLSSLGKAIGGLALLTIGFTPMAAAVLATAFVLTIAFGKVFKSSKE